MPVQLPSPEGTTSEEVVNRILSSGTKSAKPDAQLPYGCEKCDGLGNLITERGARMCECKIRWLEGERMSRANIPALFRDKTLETFQKKARAQQDDYVFSKWYASQYSRKNPKGILFIGRPGAGKTHLAVGILKELIEKGYTGLYYNIIALLDAIRASYDKDLKDVHGIQLDVDLDVDVLVLDDLGAERMSAWVADRLYAVINSRYESNRTILLTSNLKYSELGDRVGQRIISRIFEMCILHPCESEDFRSKHSQEIKKV